MKEEGERKGMTKQNQLTIGIFVRLELVTDVRVCALSRIQDKRLF
jgi:hypothetical protein